jgi:hypothetical protein
MDYFFLFQQTQKELSDINKRKLPLLKEENKLVAEVGPIKYIGDMVYGTDDTNAIDKAVRLVIMLIMVVFDPLAVLLLIAANMSMRQRNGIQSTNTNEDSPLPEPQKPEIKNQDDRDIEKPQTVEVDKENITAIEETPLPNENEILLDAATGETIPVISNKKRGFPNRKSKVEDISKYDEKAELAFREKK